MCAGSPLCAKGLLQDLRQHRASSWDSGATFHRFLWMPRWAKRTQLINRPASFYFSVFVLLNVWSLPAFVSLSLRSVFRRAPRVYTGPHDWCNQELLPEVHAPQPDMSRTLKLSARTSSFVQPATRWGLSSDSKSSPFICHRPEALSLISQEKKHHVLKSDSVSQSYHVLASPNFWEIKWNPVRCHSDALPCHCITEKNSWTPCVASDHRRLYPMALWEQLQMRMKRWRSYEGRKNTAFNIEHPRTKQ